MTSTNNLAIIDNSHFGGKHTRTTELVQWNTCDNCPAATRSSCTAVCSEMERYLAANGNTITHHSPTEAQSSWNVDEISRGLLDDGDNERSLYRPSQARLRSQLPLVTTQATPESLLLQQESSQAAVSTILSHISSFAAQTGKKDARKRSMIESVLILHYLEDYNSRRIAEILGERFEEFQGYVTVQRKTGAKAGFNYTKPKGDDKVFRIIQRFKTYVHSTHLSQAIHDVMATGTVAPIKKFATAVA